MAGLPDKCPTVSRLYQASVPGGEPGWLSGVAGRGGRADGCSGVVILGGWLCGRLFGVAVQNGGGSSGCGGCSERQAGEWFRAQPGCPGDLSGMLVHTPAHDSV